MRINYEEKSITWDREDFVMGWSRIAQTSVSDNTNFKWNESGAVNMTNIDPFRQQPGVLFPGFNPTATTGTPNSLLISAVVNTAGSVYMLGTDLNRFNTSTDTLASAGGFPRTIDHGHTNETGILGQIAIYGSTSQLVFYSFNDNTDGDVGVYYVAQNVFDDDYLSTVPSGGVTLRNGVAHPLFITSDNYLLIGDRHKVHSLRLSTNTFSQNVLNLPDDMEVVGFVEDPIGYDIWTFATTRPIGTAPNRSIGRGRSQAFVWSNDKPAFWYKSPPIPDDECAAPFFYNGTVGCFTRSRSTGGRSVLRLYENGEWKPKYYYTGSLPVPDGVDIQGNTIIFNAGGEIHQWGAYGDVWPNAGFHISTTDGGSGFLKVIGDTSSATNIYSANDTTVSNNRVIKFSDFINSATWQGMAARPDFPFRKKMKIVAAEVHFGGGGSTTRTIDLDLIKEEFGVGLISVFSDLAGAGGANTVRTYLQDEFETRDDTLQAHVAPRFTWNAGSGATTAPGVERVKIYYELDDYQA